MINDQIRKARRKAGMSQDEFARQIGVSRAAVSYYENGLRKPNSETIRRIAKGLNVSAQELLELDEESSACRDPARWDENHRCTACGCPCVTVSLAAGQKIYVETPHCPSCGEKMESINDHEEDTP